jgi:hypothetical protein
MNDYVERVKDEDPRPRDMGAALEAEWRRATAASPPKGETFAATLKSEALGPLAMLVMGLPPGTTLSFEVSLPGRTDE